MTLKEEVLQLQQEKRMLQEQLAERDNQIAQMQQQIAERDNQIDALRHPKLSPRKATGLLYVIATTAIGFLVGLGLYAFGKLPTVVLTIASGISAAGALLALFVGASIERSLPRGIWKNAHHRVITILVSIITVALLFWPILVISSPPICQRIGTCSPESTAAIAQANAQATANAHATETAIVETPCVLPPGTPTVTPPIAGALPIYVGKFADDYQKSGNLVHVVNTKDESTVWAGITDTNGVLRMPYPPEQKSGLVSITKSPSQPSQDLSKYRELSLELCGENGGESIVIGLKDNKVPPREPRIVVSGLTTKWKTYKYPLSSFADTGIDLHNVYVVTEFIFEGTKAETVEVRNIQYLP